MRESSHTSKHVNMSATKRGMTGGVPPHPLVAYEGVVHFEFFELCNSPTKLRVVGAGFAKG